MKSSFAYRLQKQFIQADDRFITLLKAIYTNEHCTSTTKLSYW
jgi:hypothetical protein